MKPNAQYQARHRIRRALGVQVVPVDVDQPMIEALVMRGVLPAARMGDPDAIARAIQTMVDNSAAVRISRLFGPGQEKK